MRFLFTMNMPSFNGHLVHQIIGDHGSKSLDDLTDFMSKRDFIIVSEVYKDTTRDSVNYYPKGDVVLSCLHIGKVKEFST